MARQLRLRAGQTLTGTARDQASVAQPSANRLKLIEIGCGEALGDEDTVRLEG